MIKPNSSTVKPVMQIGNAVNCHCQLLLMPVEMLMQIPVTMLTPLQFHGFYASFSTGSSAWDNKNANVIAKYSQFMLIYAN